MNQAFIGELCCALEAVRMAGLPDAKICDAISALQTMPEIPTEREQIASALASQGVFTTLRREELAAHIETRFRGLYDIGQEWYVVESASVNASYNSHPGGVVEVASGTAREIGAGRTLAGPFDERQEAVDAAREIVRQER